MRQILRNIFGTGLDIRKGERTLTLLMFSNYYLILVTYYLLKPARDSLFLVKVSFEQLPLVFIITALVTVPVVDLYSKASKRFKLGYLINLTTVVIIVNLFVLRWLIQYDEPWIYYLFYSWVSVYGVLTTSQFWLFSNSIYDAAQAKRIFSILALGGIIGAFTGGQVTSLFVSKLGVSTEDLLFFCVGFLVISIVLVSITLRLKVIQGVEPALIPRAGTKQTKESLAQLFKTVNRSRYLTLVVGVVALTVMSHSFVDYLFKGAGIAAFPEKNQFTAFQASVYSWLSIGSLFIQGFFTNRFLRILGVGSVILFLPSGLLLGSSAYMLYPGLLAAIILFGADGVFRYSIDKTGKELLFLPVPPAVKKRTKLFIDIFVDRWFRGFAGGLLLLCTFLKLSLGNISLVLIASIAVWILLSLLLRKEYVNTFRKALERRQINPEELRLRVDDAQSLNAIIASLGSLNERQVIYALKMLDSVDEKELKWPVKPLLVHPSEEVRSNALKVMLRLGDAKDLPEIEKLLMDPNIGIRADAIRFLSTQGENKMAKLVRGFLSHSDQQIRHAAIACIASYGDDSEKALISNELIEELLGDKGKYSEEGRIEVARALGEIDLHDANKYLRRLLDDDSREVRIAAIQSIGKQRDRDFVPWLIGHLADSDLRPHCRTSLSLFGTAVLGTLNDYLNDEKLPLSIRRHIPRVMALIPNQVSVNFLLHSFESQNSWLNYDVLKGLNKLRAKSFDLKFGEKEVATALQNETKHFYEILQILNAQHNSNTPESQLLKKSLQERLDANLEKIFRLMGLQYPPRDIYNAYLSITSNRRIERAKALEFLDSLLDTNIKKYVLPILDDVSPEITAQKGRELFKLGIKSEEDGLSALIKGNNVWLKVCAIYNVNQNRTDRLVGLVKESLHERDPMVRETAKLVLSKVNV